MKTNPKTKLGQYLVGSGLVKLRDVNRCLRKQKLLRGRGEHCLLGELLVREGLLSSEALCEALAALGALVARCPRCGFQSKVTAYQQGKPEHCARCRSVLVYQDVGVRPTGGKPIHAGPDPGGGEKTAAAKDSEGDPLIDRIIGGCQILERIGRGGMGVVYKAKQLNLGRTVAVKILAEELANDETFVRRFMHEARAAGELNHGNIVHINDVGELEGIFYFTMEYVDGRNLIDVLKERQRLEPLEAAQIGFQVCQALRHAHRKDIIHRDIKPENIMLACDGIVKLADLGLAKRVTDAEAGLTQAGAVMGTPYYMAPEQATDSSKVDKRSDIYSLGVTLYRALTGRVPFEGKTPLEVIIKAVSGAKRAIQELRPEVPGDLAALVHRMMEPDPEKRYQDVQEVIDDLGEVIENLRCARQA